ncbi:MAG: hypothetical protein FJ138_14670, partial [Deltaproteobacteria bacterium]|nr:hypothetical protein [Deltaproteobacteria bacterium]
MCLILLLGGLVTVVVELRLLATLSKALGLYGASWLLGVFVLTFWLGARLLRRARDPRYAAQWAEWAASGNPRARPQDALVPAAQALGALLLMAPGVLTDLLGLALQSPLVARAVAGRLARSAAGVVLGGAAQGGFGGRPFGGAEGGGGGGEGGGGG